MVDLKQFLVAPSDSIRDVMACVDRNAKGIALVVRPGRQLIATVTDGDIRRAILAGLDLDLPVRGLLEKRTTSPYPKTITARMGTSEGELIRLMNERSLRHIPLLDRQGRAVDIALLSDLVKQYELPVTAVVMAGGYGTRLRPLTKKLPKPMLPVGREPVLEFIVKRLRRAGIRRINISTHYKAEKITKHFGNGNAFDVDLRYINENRPLGTAGALSLIELPKKPILVINGDVLTNVNLHAMLDFHREHKAEMTVAVQKYDVQVSYGVVETEDFFVRRLTEKPKFTYFLNAGIYLLEPSVIRLVPKGQRFDMTDLIQKLLDAGRSVASFPIREYWLDIGNHGDYKQALGDRKKGRLKV